MTSGCLYDVKSSNNVCLGLYIDFMQKNQNFEKYDIFDNSQSERLSPTLRDLGRVCVV